jgi:hypothetical protein
MSARPNLVGEKSRASNSLTTRDLLGFRSGGDLAAFAGLGSHFVRKKKSERMAAAATGKTFAQKVWDFLNIPSACGFRSRLCPISNSKNARKYPIVMWHAGGQFSKTWETTPDGRSGYRTSYCAMVTQRISSISPEEDELEGQP